MLGSRTVYGGFSTPDEVRKTIELAKRIVALEARIHRLVERERAPVRVRVASSAPNDP